jgi:hypothetical protein
VHGVGCFGATGAFYGKKAFSHQYIHAHISQLALISFYVDAEIWLIVMKKIDLRE